MLLPSEESTIQRVMIEIMFHLIIKLQDSIVMRYVMIISMISLLDSFNYQRLAV